MSLEEYPWSQPATQEEAIPFGTLGSIQSDGSLRAHSWPRPPSAGPWTQTRDKKHFPWDLSVFFRMTAALMHPLPF